MWPTRLPHRSQNDIAGPAIGLSVSSSVTVVAADPPAPPAGVGDIFALVFCVPSNGSPDTMPRAWPSRSNPPAIRVVGATTLHASHRRCGPAESVS